MHGNNKSEEELVEAIDSGIGRLVVDNFDELDRLERLYQRTGKVLDVLLRVTPGVEAHTHHYIATGQDDTKFGFTLSTGAASAAVTRARSMESIRLRGIHLHIGSQVFLVDSFAAALGVVASFVKNHHLEELSMGGGLGVAYVEGEHAPSMVDWAKMLTTAATEAGIETSLSVEPGRAIAAQAAITLYTVGTIKEIPGVRTYVAVDGGMSDNPRPVLYGSGYETFLPRAVAADRPRSVRLVGKHCESGDVLVMYGRVPDDLVVGDIIATPVTGAYGHSMGSNYNKVGRPAVVFVKDGDARLVVRRETYEDLVRNDL
jgi:diaminopimelate decarboxylase